MFCQNCGTQLSGDVIFCWKCGVKVALKKDVQQSAEELGASNEVVVNDDCSDLHSDTVSCQPFPMIDNEKSSKGFYGECIKPYYCEEFDRIASGQKPKFNWAAFFLNGWVQLYNGCTKMFCKTFLPLLIALFVVGVISIVGISQFNLTAMIVASILTIMLGICSIILSIVNGCKFNKWYYEDVVGNLGKRRSRKGFWVLLVCEAITIGGLSALPYILFDSFEEDYVADWSDDKSFDSQVDYEDNVSHGASAEMTKQILLDWFQRRPLMHDIRVRFLEEAADTKDETSYFLYEMYIEQEYYGILRVDPDNGDIFIDSMVDSYGNWAAVQIPMDQWYLEYYWGYTDDSGYFTELYEDGLYIIHNAMGGSIIEYYAYEDRYIICDFDGRNFIEYDDGTEASRISIMDFAGVYGYDDSIDEDGVYVDFYYSLEIGEWDGDCFSILESWRGIDLLQDEWARPISLVVDTLTFEIYSSDSASYETHSLTYIPARKSPLGQDTIYLDNDDTMPFVRE